MSRRRSLPVGKRRPPPDSACSMRPTTVLRRRLPGHDDGLRSPRAARGGGADSLLHVPHQRRAAASGARAGRTRRRPAPSGPSSSGTSTRFAAPDVRTRCWIAVAGVVTIVARVAPLLPVFHAVSAIRQAPCSATAKPCDAWVSRNCCWPGQERPPARGTTCCELFTSSVLALAQSTCCSG